MNDATIITSPPQRSVPATMTEPPLGADNYQIGGEIARGGMGSILEAEDSKLKRTVAVKIMHLDANADASVRQRFLREAEVLAMLAHPNIVPIYDIVWEDGLPLFYSMKMVKGRTLQDILTALRHHEPKALHDYTLDRLLLIFRKVCDAIAFAHSKGVLHRDLKPENVMVGEFGEVLVMDWGLAKMMRIDEVGRAVPSPPCEAHESPDTLSHERSAGAFYNCAVGTQRPTQLSATLQGSVMGTPQYMSPEQAMGQIDELDERSDIFSLGGILYAILTLRPPVEGKTLEEVLSKVTSAEITPPSVLGSTTGKRLAQAKGDVLDAKLVKPLPHSRSGRVPAALSAVVMKSLRLGKEQRYQSVAEFSADIEAYQSGFATKAEQAGLGKQLALLIKRHRGMFTTAAAACLFITTLAVWFVINLRAKERRALAGEQKAIASEAVAVQEKEATRRALAKSAFALAESALREGNGVAMKNALSDVPEDLRDNTWHYLQEQSDTSFASIRTNAAHISSVAAHPRLPSVFAVADSDGKVSLIEVRSGVRQLEFDPGFTLKIKNARYCIAFSPDGEQLAVGRNAGGIVIHNARDGTLLREWATPGTFELVFSPDGQLLLLNETIGRQLSVWDARSGGFAWAYEASKLVNALGVFTPDSQQVLTFSFGDDFRVVDARKGTLIRALKMPRDRVSALTMETDGTAVSVDNSGYVTRFEIQEGRVLSEFRAQDKGFRFIIPSPSGEQLVTAMTLADGRQALQVWRGSTGERTQALLGGSSDIASVSLHPLSGELLVSGLDTRVWSIGSAPARWLIPSQAVSDTIAFWGADTLFASNTLFRLDAESTTLLWRAGPNARTIWPSVSADGRFAIVGSTAENRLILLRNPGAEIAEVSSFTSERMTRDVRLSPTGDRVAVIELSHHRLALHETAKGKRLARPDHTNINKFWDIGWLSEGKRIVGLVTARAERGTPGSEEWVVLWDAATGQILQTAANSTQMNNLAIAPDGRCFAEAGVDKRVRIRDAETLAVKQEFRAHDGAITALAWHPTRPILATGSADLCLRLWDLDTGRRLEELRGPLAPPSSLVFSPCGQRLACNALLEATRVWEPRSLNEVKVKRLEK